MHKDEAGHLTYTTEKLPLIKDLNIIPKTMKVLEENVGKTLQDTGFDNDSLNIKHKAQARKAKIDKTT